MFGMVYHHACPNEVEAQRQYGRIPAAEADRAKPTLWKSRSYPLSPNTSASINWVVEYTKSETEDSEVDAEDMYTGRLGRFRVSERRHRLHFTRGISASSSGTIDGPSIFTKPPSLHTVDSSATRPSMWKRLKSSTSLSSTARHLHKSVICPSDFQELPEIPETRFIDSAGVVIPGVCDRIPCASQRVHFVSAIQLSEPIEYTTALAEHGITYSDYARLIEAMQNLVAELSQGTRQQREGDLLDQEPTRQRVAKQMIRGWSRVAHGAAAGKRQQSQHTQHYSAMLDQLLEGISQNLRARGVPVVICVSSYPSLLNERCLEVQVQILHVPFTQSSHKSTKSQARVAERSSFMDLSALKDLEGYCVSASRCRYNKESSSTLTSAQNGVRPLYGRNDSCVGEQVCPWPIWPNAIPSSKRRIMAANAERYGVDPYFRDWLRASFESRVTCGTYDEYLAEIRRRSFVTERSEEIERLPRHALAAPKYLHSRQRELRRSIERGFRFRLLSFGGSSHAFPPHNAELDDMGLSKAAYETVVARVGQITRGRKVTTHSPCRCVSSFIRKACLRRQHAMFLELQEYLRELNSAQRHIVWTVETISDACGDHSGWNISAWNGEDPLELLMELERCNIVEKRLTDDEY